MIKIDIKFIRLHAASSGATKGFTLLLYSHTLMYERVVPFSPEFYKYWTPNPTPPYSSKKCLPSYKTNFVDTF